MEQLINISLGFRCQKAFNELVPCNGGWYCNGCHKLVHDMRGRSEEEIDAIFATQGYKLCGLFETDRIRVNAPLSKWRKWLSAAVLALGFTGLYQTLLAQQHIKKDSSALATKKTTVAPDDNLVFGGPDQAAEFRGGFEKLSAYLHNTLKPDSSCHTGQKAFYQFMVEIDGRITNIKAIRNPFSAAMDKQIRKALANSPRWKPGMLFGKPVRQQYTLPVIPVAQ